MPPFLRLGDAVSEPESPIQPIPANADASSGSSPNGDEALGPVAWGLGSVFFLLWRLAGLMAWPILILHPGARRHMIGLRVPSPGWTWLHGASAGEHTAARALAEAIGSCWRTSSSWRTDVAGALPAPLDLPFCVSRWLDTARPRRLILVEAELWPGWIVACRKRGIPVAVVNARAGQGTNKWRKVGPLWRWLSHGVQFIPQSETGDLKLSAATPASSFDPGREIIAGASTRHGDEQRLIEAWEHLPTPRPLLVLAPRHPHRFDEVRAILEDSGHPWFQRTGPPQATGEIMLLDTMGELSGLYRYARAAFVGGTFDPKIGGHSPAEAFAAGIPVVHGPHTTSNPVAWSQGASFEATGDADLKTALQAALSTQRTPPPSSASAAKCAALLPPGRMPDPTWARPWLLPLVPLWSVASAVQRWMQRPGPKHPIPVVVVGGLTWGGAGRTPAVGWMAERIPGAWVVSAGYRRTPQGPDVRLGRPNETPRHDLGDELELMRRRGIPVVSSPNRSVGIRQAAKEGARIVLIDGGYGNPSLNPDMRVLCLHSDWPMGRGPIPVGSRRLPRRTIEDADALWITGEGIEGLPEHAPTAHAQLKPTGWLHKGQHFPLESVTGAVDIRAGIARPERFVCTLLGMGLQIRSLRTARDHGQLGDLPPGAVVTEKDAARLPIDSDVWALQLGTEVTGADALIRSIEELAR